MSSSEEAIDLVPLLRQRLAWDMLGSRHDHWDALQIIPPSAEAHDTIEAESQRRMRTIVRYQHLLDVYSILCADIITEVMYQNLRELIDMEDDATVKAAHAWHKTAIDQNRDIVRGSVYPIIAHMLEAGILRDGDTSVILV